MDRPLKQAAPIITDAMRSLSRALAESDMRSGSALLCMRKLRTAVEQIDDALALVEQQLCDDGNVELVVSG